MRSLPNQSEPVVETKSSKATIPWYGWFDELWRKLRGLWSIDGTKLLYIQNGTIKGATVGDNLELDTENQVLNATNSNPFPEAPIDGTKYGRIDASWQQIREGDPADPVYSVQFNEGGVFGGSAEFLYDEENNTIWVGATASHTISPVGNDANGIDLTIKGGDQTAHSSVGSSAGDLTLKGGSAISGGTGELGGRVFIQTTSGNYATGGIRLTTGDSTANGYNSGGISLTTGYVGFISQSGSIVLRTGEGAYPTASSSGDIDITTGDGGTGSGDSIVGTGVAGNSGRSGSLFLTTGDGGSSGDIWLLTGDATSTTGTKGKVYIGGTLRITTTGPLYINGETGVDGAFLRSTGSTTSPVWVKAGTAYGSPRYVAASTTYTIEQYYQVLFTIPIEVDGILEVFGDLVEMD